MLASPTPGPREGDPRPRAADNAAPGLPAVADLAAAVERRAGTAAAIAARMDRRAGRPGLLAEPQRRARRALTEQPSPSAQHDVARELLSAQRIPEIPGPRSSATNSRPSISGLGLSARGY